LIVHGEDYREARVHPYNKRPPAVALRLLSVLEAGTNRFAQCASVRFAVDYAAISTPASRVSMAALQHNRSQIEFETELLDALS
jgi:hypothetical protein